MPAAFFTEAERERRSRFPLEVTGGDLATYFVLTPADLACVGQYRGESNRLGAAVQLIAVRFMGFCPRDLATIPSEALAFVASQLGVDPGALAGYGVRAQTRTEHLAAVREHLGWRSPSAEELTDLAEWLVERALEHDKPSLLFTLSAQRLRSRRVTRPAVTTLERLVAGARRQALVETARRLTPLLTDDTTTMLDALLDREGDTGRTPLVWLRQGAATNSPAAILDAADKLSTLPIWRFARRRRRGHRPEIHDVCPHTQGSSISDHGVPPAVARFNAPPENGQSRDKLAYLQKRGIDGWILDAVPPNRRKHLARRGRRSSAEALRRVPSERRYPILACFVHQSLQDITDETVDLFDRCIAQTEARARRQLEEFRRRTARARNEKLRLLLKIGRLVLDPNLPDDRLRRRIYDIMPAAALGAAMDDTERLVGAKGTDHLGFLLARYPYVRRFAPRLLEALDLRTTRDGESLMAAIEFLRSLNADGRRKITAQLDPPLDFVPRRWRPFVVDGSGNVDRRAYEMCALWELRGALRAGHVWLPAGRRYADPESYLISRQDWPAQRSEVCAALDVPADGAVRLCERKSQLEELLERPDGILPRGPSLRLEAGGLVLSPLAGEGMPPSAERLSQAVGERLPRVELPSLLVEVDGWTGFSRHLTHAGDQDSRVPNLATYLYASVLAQACNLGLAEMARIADVSERRLRWCTNWYIREETLRPGIAAIVNCQHREPLARHWGGGTLSSSDGQRFPVAVKSRHARALPRYFGYGTGLTFYTLECELLERSVFRTPAEAHPAVFEYIEAFYNRQRRHSALGYLSPAAFEADAQSERLAA